MAGALDGKVALVAGGAVVAIWPDRLGVVGTFAQYRGDFGLHGYEGPLLRGGVAMGALLMGGIAYLLIRIRISIRRALRTTRRRPGTRPGTSSWSLPHGPGWARLSTRRRMGW